MRPQWEAPKDLLNQQICSPQNYCLSKEETYRTSLRAWVPGEIQTFSIPVSVTEMPLNAISFNHTVICIMGLFRLMFWPRLKILSQFGFDATTACGDRPTDSFSYCTPPVIRTMGTVVKLSHSLSTPAYTHLSIMNFHHHAEGQVPPSVLDTQSQNQVCLW